MTAKNNDARPQMQDGEKLVWTGTPCEYRDYSKIDWVLLPVCLLLLALSTFYAVLLAAVILRSGWQPHYTLSLLLLFIVGGFSVYAYFLRYSVKRRIKADLVYGITSCGRVIIRDQATRRIFTIDPKHVTAPAAYGVDKNGVGTVYFRKKRLSNLFDNTGMEFFASVGSVKAALYDIEDCEKIAKLLKKNK